MAKKAVRKRATRDEGAAVPIETLPSPEPIEKPLVGASVPYNGDDKTLSLMTKDSPRRREIVLEQLSKGLSYLAAANAAGISRRLIFLWREKDKAFDAACNEAHQAGIDAMEDEALRRAVQGTDRPVYQQGMLVGYVREYSDRLLEMNLKARRPEKWKENADPNKDKPITVYLDEVDSEA